MAFNEMTPGMNTQAKKPDFAQQNGVMPMGPPAPPPPEPKSIREYLNAVKAKNQVPFFSNVAGDQGGGVDPNTGQPIAPAMQFQSIGSQGQIMPPGEAAPAIPEPGSNPADKHVIGDDPYDMAKQRLEHLLPEIWQQMFPGKQPGGELSPKDYDKWIGAVNHVNNELIKNYELKVKDTRKRGESLIKDYTPKSVQKYMKSNNLEDLEKSIDWVSIENKMRGDLEKEYDKLGQYAEEETGQTKNAYIDTRVASRLKSMQDSVESRRIKAMGKKPGATAGGQNGTNMVPPELQERFKAATADYQRMKSAKHGATGKPLPHEKILETLGIEYPELKPYF